MFQLLGVEATKAHKSFDTTVISRVQKVGSIVPLEIRIYAVWSLNIEGGNILYNSVEMPNFLPGNVLGSVRLCSFLVDPKKKLHEQTD